MCSAPQQLADSLRVSSDSDDPSFPQVKLWFIYSSDFQDVEGRRVEEIERNEGCDPDSFMNPRDASAKKKKKKKKNSEEEKMRALIIFPHS